MKSATGLSKDRLAGETDDTGVLCRRYANELRNELAAEGGLDGLLEAVRRPSNLGGRYRTAVASSARSLLNYSGHGYPAAGVDGYGDVARVIPGVDDADYELARRIIDEVDLLSAERTLDELIPILRNHGYTFPAQRRRDVAEELRAARRARRAGA